MTSVKLFFTCGILPKKFPANVRSDIQKSPPQMLNEKNFGKDKILITMGAGDIYKIHKEII